MEVRIYFLDPSLGHSSRCSCCEAHIRLILPFRFMLMSFKLTSVLLSHTGLCAGASVERPSVPGA